MNEAVDKMGKFFDGETVYNRVGAFIIRDYVWSLEALGHQIGVTKHKCDRCEENCFKACAIPGKYRKFRIHIKF